MTYEIMYKYPSGEAECIDTADGRKERDELLSEYRLAFREGRLWARRERS